MNGLSFVVALDLILLVRAPIVFRIIQQILRYVDAVGIECHILILNPKLLAVRVQECKVLANQAEIVIIFPLLELPPRISNLRAFKRRRVEERPGVFEPLAVLTKEDVMMNAFAAG